MAAIKEKEEANAQHKNSDIDCSSKEMGSNIKKIEILCKFLKMPVYFI